MLIPKTFVSIKARIIIERNRFAKEAYNEITESIHQNATNSMGQFIINCSEKKCNGVVPIKDGIYRFLEESYGWYREKPLQYFANVKGGPIDAYKEFGDQSNSFNVGLEFETGNVSSAHRAMNKLCMGIHNGEFWLSA